MYSKILILRFPKTEVQKPVVYHLTKDYDLVFNILNAAILPRKEGVMALELSGTKKNFKDGVKFLKAQGVHVKNASQAMPKVDLPSYTDKEEHGEMHYRSPKISILKPGSKIYRVKMSSA